MLPSATVRAGAAQHDVVLVDRKLEALRKRVDRLLEAVVAELRDAAAAVADDVMVVLAARVRRLVAGGAVADVEAVDEPEPIEHLERAVDAREPTRASSSRSSSAICWAVAQQS